LNVRRFIDLILTNGDVSVERRYARHSLEVRSEGDIHAQTWIVDNLARSLNL
jgi:hypothetical protein